MGDQSSPIRKLVKLSRALACSISPKKFGRGNGVSLVSSCKRYRGAAALIGRYGSLVGRDVGEFDGGLTEFNRAGEPVAQHPSVTKKTHDSGFEDYISPNVQALYRVGRRIVVVRGLDHMGLNDGAIEIYEGSIGRGLSLFGALALPGYPNATAIGNGGSVFAAVRHGLLEVDLRKMVITVYRPPSQIDGNSRETHWNRRAHVDAQALFQEMEAIPWRGRSKEAWLGFRPTSMVADETAVYISVGPMVVRMKCTKDGGQVSWWTRKDVLCRLA